MAAYADMTTAELQAELNELQRRYHDFQARDLRLNMARGKPSPEQLDLNLGLLSALPDSERPLASDGEDTRNYGSLLGIPEARALLAELLAVPADNVYAAGNSSLNLMYDALSRAMLYGVRGGQPLCQQGPLRWLCPVPGYDRHFAITETLGLENVPIPMLADGPDMDRVEQLVNQDKNVKGIWCVPKYANPTGITYSDAVVRRFAALRPAAADFRIYWDNAYAVHDLFPGAGDTLLNLKEACEAAGNPDIYYQFASTSKISFAAGGISALATSEANLQEMAAQIAIQNIGPDKVNQLRHVRWFEQLGGGPGQGMAGILRHMQELALIIAPKFAVVQEVLASELDGLGIASWTTPRGGYFISLDALPGTARRTVDLAKQAGVVLTEAGATWPGGQDPADSNIRIAPTYPALAELELASQLLTICLRLAAVEQLLTASRDVG